MKVQEFTRVVTYIVSKVADRKPVDVDPEFNVQGYFDPGADDVTIKGLAWCAAADLLAENGFIEPWDPGSSLTEEITIREALEASSPG